MRRSLEDAMNNAFEETTMKNVSIDQFLERQTKKRSPKSKSTQKIELDTPC